jgi:hypothetical protein
MTFVDPGGDHVDVLRDEGAVEARTITVQLIPAGATRRIGRLRRLPVLIGGASQSDRNTRHKDGAPIRAGRAIPGAFLRMFNLLRAVPAFQCEGGLPRRPKESVP